MPIFSESAGVAESIFKNDQMAIRLLCEHNAEACEQQSVLKHLFLMGKSKHFSEKYTSLTAMDGFKPVGEGGAYPEDGMVEGFSKTIEHETWKDRFVITREMVDDTKIVDFKQKPKNFIASYYRTRERFGAALYGAGLKGETKFAFSGKEFDATGADKLPVFSSKHPSKIDAKKTQSNVCGNAFSEDALGRAEVAMQNFRGDNNEILGLSPDTIVIPNEHNAKKTVFAVIGADKDPNTANNGFNYLFGRWRIIVWNYLNEFISKDSIPWIILDSNYNESHAGAIWSDRVDLEVKSSIDENTDNNRWNGYSRFGAGFNDWRFAMAGGVTGAAELA